MILHYHMAIMKLYAHRKCLVASEYVPAHSATWHREWSNRSITRMNAFTVSLCVGSCFLRGKYHDTVDLPSWPQNNAYFITTVWVVIDTDENNGTTWTCMYSCKGYLALATKIIWFYFDKFVVSRSIVHAFAYLVRLVHIHFDTVILCYLCGPCRWSTMVTVRQLQSEYYACHTSSEATSNMSLYNTKPDLCEGLGESPLLRAGAEFPACPA